MDAWGGQAATATHEMEVVTDAQMRHGSVSHPEKQTVQERTWGFAARVDPTVTFEEVSFTKNMSIGGGASQRYRRSLPTQAMIS